MKKKFIGAAHSKRGRKKMSQQEIMWMRIHEPLSDILTKLIYYRTQRGYAKVAYGGYMEELKRACRRITNMIESYEEQLAQMSEEK